MKKNLWKIMAALMIIALPFVMNSCKSDDDEGPKTYTWTWTLQNTTLPGSPTVAEEDAAMAAKKSINALFAAEFTKRGFTVDVTAQTLKVETEDTPDTWDDYAKRAVNTVKGQDALAVAAEALPANAKIVVKRGSKVLVDKKLAD